jgi:hypothetical protein
VTGNGGPTGRIELSGFELFDGISHGARTTRDHSDAGGGERRVGIRAAITGENELHVLGCHELSRLNTGPSAERSVRVLDGFEFHGVRIDDQEVRAAAEPRIEVGIQRWATSCDCDSH